MEMLLKIKIFLIGLAIVNSCDRTSEWSGFKDAMLEGVKFYLYLVKDDYAFQKLGDSCATVTFHRTQTDPLKWNVNYDFVLPNGEPGRTVIYGKETAPNTGQLSYSVEIDGENTAFNASEICGELGMTKGRLIGTLSCNPTNGKYAFWLGFDHRRTQNNITDEEKATLATCLKNNNININELHYVNNDNCDGY